MYSCFPLTSSIGANDGGPLNFLLNHTSLDNGQATALYDTLQRELAYTNGPPGTGKTYLGIALTRALLASRRDSGRSSRPILVVCLTNHALDSFLAGLRGAGVQKLLRVGSGSKADWTDAINIKKFGKKELPKYHMDGKMSAVRRKEVLFADIDSWCKGFNAQKQEGRMSWHSVKTLLEQVYPRIYRQLVTASDTPFAQSFAFDYWAGGGDLRNLDDLQQELSLRLAHTLKEKKDLDIQRQVERILQQITLHTRGHSIMAGTDTVWNLALSERERLLATWAREINHEQLGRYLATLHMRHRDADDDLRAAFRAINANVMLNHDVIGMTTTACADRWDTLKEIGFEIMICEEAGEVMEAHTLCALLPNLQHAVFIGDPLQLRPEVAEQSMSLESRLGSHYRLDESLFERFMKPTDPAAGVMPVSNLNIQRRMHPEIANITRLTYPYLQDHDATAMHPTTMGLADRMFWLDHRVPESAPTEASKSHSNFYEVAMVVGLVNHLLPAYSLREIAVLTPYNGQLAALHESLKMTCKLWLSPKDRETMLDEGLLEDELWGPSVQEEVSLFDMLRIATIDNFQGEEAKVIILTTVRSGGRIGFLKTINRINVACSRARNGFYIIGNSETLQQVPMWNEIIDVFARNNRIGPSLRTCCNRHPEHHFDIYCPQDFARVEPCTIPCDQQLPCGHQCQGTCHPIEVHDRIPCIESCQKTLECGHLCENVCYEDCGRCEYTMGQQLLSCGHQADILCSRKTPICQAVIEEINLPCRHKLSLRCAERHKQFFCGQQCAALFDCGHTCQALCGDCGAGDHPLCSSVCGKEISCGHFCRSPCHGVAGCPPCNQPCRESCPHGPCRNLCNLACDPCVRPHKRTCAHQQATEMLCSLPSDIMPCSEPCKKGERFLNWFP